MIKVIQGIVGIQLRQILVIGGLPPIQGCPFLCILFSLIENSTTHIATKERAELNDEWIGERLQGDHRGQRK